MESEALRGLFFALNISRHNIFRIQNPNNFVGHGIIYATTVLNDGGRMEEGNTIYHVKGSVI